VTTGSISRSEMRQQMFLPCDRRDDANVDFHTSPAESCLARFRAPMPSSAAAMSERTGVLFVNSPDQFGADTWVNALVMKHLDRSRYDVHAAVTPETNGQPSASLKILRDIPDLHVRPTDFGPSLAFASPLQKVMKATGLVRTLVDQAALVRYIRQRHIRVIHSTDRPRDAIACLGLARASGAKAVIHIHIKCDHWMSRGVKFSMRNADALIGVSQHVARSTATFGIAPHKAHAVLNAIEVEKWTPGLDAQPIRDEFRIPPGAPIILCVARLFHWKGQGELIRALGLVTKEFPETRLFIVGAEDKLGGSSRPHYRAELDALAQELRLNEQVFFTGPRNDIPRLMAACDVFAMPSFEEPFGLVYAEAMAMKKPVIALDNGGTPEVVDHGQSGLLSPPADIPALANNILALLRDPGLRARMGEYGRRQVETRFHARRLADDVGSVYDSLL
jgi:glycosyltransferase involved in cell wall biosynthesis